jgi:leucine zipper transcription factor-like protein 1
MNEENNRLKDRLKQVESQTLTIQKEKNQLQSELDNAKKQIGSLTNQMPDTSSADVDDMRQKMAGLRSSLDKSASQGKAQAAAMENELTSAKHELLRVREMLEMAEKELEKKVSQTAPFQNLKQILQKRNDQLKDMRRRLSKYERVDE